jgi:hypothetical protein
LRGNLDIRRLSVKIINFGFGGLNMEDFLFADTIFGSSGHGMYVGGFGDEMRIWVRMRRRGSWRHKG